MKQKRKKGPLQLHYKGPGGMFILIRCVIILLACYFFLQACSVPPVLSADTF